MEKVFEQNGKSVLGGPFMIQMLFKEPVSFPNEQNMIDAIGSHCGDIECFCYDEKVAGFAIKDHLAQFKDTSAPVQLMVMSCVEFDSSKIDTFLRSQMWDCMNERERIFEECKYQVVAIDMLASGLSAVERANLDMDFLEALAKLYPSCEAFYFQNCGKLFLAEDVRNHQMKGISRFINFGVNARFFNIEGTEDMLVDTLGMGTLFLPDLQYHFHGVDPNWAIIHAYNLAEYLLQNDCPINSGDTIDGIYDGVITRDIQWKCYYEESLIEPYREVLDICMGENASGQRDY